jgi:hypothetical protein
MNEWMKIERCSVGDCLLVCASRLFDAMRVVSSVLCEIRGETSRFAVGFRFRIYGGRDAVRRETSLSQ